MIILRSEVMGFCAGVRTAVQKVYDAVDLGRRTERKVYTIGPLIHNEEFLRHLREENGVEVIESPENALPGIGVIRAHGITKAERKAFEEAGFELVDGTCVRVQRSQKLVSQYAAKGWQIIIAGDPSHGEVKAILGEIPAYEDAYIITDAEQAVRIIDLSKNVLLLSQTTFSAEGYAEITARLRELFLESASSLEIVESICPSTRSRQNALRDLMEKSDAILVIGGRNSANTRRLFQLSLEAGKPAWHIAGIEELDAVAISTYGTIGITAGASTPEWLIDEVIDVLRRLGE